MTTQDHELSAALGWPKGISDPVLDRKTLLQMVAALRLASQQALGAWDGGDVEWFKRAYTVMDALRAALAQQAEPVEPVEPVAWVASKDGRVIYDDASKDDSLLRVSGDFENDEQRISYAKQIVDKLNAASAQQKDPTDPGHDVDVLREHVRHLERRVRELHAQKPEPVHDRHGACPTHCCPIHGCKYMHDDCPVVSGAVKPVYPRNNGCESCAEDALAQQAEPLDLADPAVQKRLASQWGYVPAAAQAEPVEPVAWRTFDGEGGYDYRTYEDNEHYAAAWAQRNPNHVGWVEPLYIAPPQRKLVPLTEGEIEDIYLAWDVTPGRRVAGLVRAVERAHEIKE